MIARSGHAIAKGNAVPGIGGGNFVLVDSFARKITAGRESRMVKAEPKSVNRQGESVFQIGCHGWLVHPCAQELTSHVVHTAGQASSGTLGFSQSL